MEKKVIYLDKAAKTFNFTFKYILGSFSSAIGTVFIFRKTFEIFGLDNVIILPFKQPLFFTLLAFLIGLGLYFFKKKQQIWYGIAEVAFGIASCWTILNHELKEIQFLSILASIYILVRGFTNVDEGFNKKYTFVWESTSQTPT